MSSVVRGAYWPSYSNFNPENINTHYFTHIYYAFVQLNRATFELNIPHNDHDLMNRFINALRNSSLKTLLSIGGANASDVFSVMAQNYDNRARFISSTIERARELGFDGLDLDWEFPKSRQEMENLGQLLREWYTALSLEANQSGKPRLLLTAAVLYTPTVSFEPDVPRSYPSHAFMDCLDWVNVMCYDYNTGWAHRTGNNADLTTTQQGIRAWIDSGVVAEKMALGLPLYGKKWILQNPNNHGIGAPAEISLNPDKSYSEIIPFNQQNGAVVVYDEQNVAYYSYTGTDWISYDDVGSITRKVQYARGLRMKGYFFWAIGMDMNWTLSQQAMHAWGTN